MSAFGKRQQKAHHKFKVSMFNTDSSRLLIYYIQDFISKPLQQPSNKRFQDTKTHAGEVAQPLKAKVHNQNRQEEENDI